METHDTPQRSSLNKLNEPSPHTGKGIQKHDDHSYPGRPVMLLKVKLAQQRRQPHLQQPVPAPTQLHSMIKLLSHPTTRPCVSTRETSEHLAETTPSQQ